MNDQPPVSAAGTEKEYDIRYEPAEERVRVEFNGTWVADSSNAVICYETRAPRMFYFPFEDVNQEYLEKTNFQTHCPFKGNASYWSLKVGDKIEENAVWGYEDPYSDGEELRGLVSFYQSKVSSIYEGDEEVAFLDNDRQSMHSNTLAGWLLEQAWKAPSAAELMLEFCKYLNLNGYPLSRMTIIIPTLHPQIFANVLVWREDDPEIKVILEPHDILTQPKFSDSPFAPIIKGAGGVRRRLEGDSPKLDYPVCKDLHEEGATDYAAMPFTFSDGQINVMSMTCFAKGGFSTSNLGQIFEMLPMLGRLFEVHAQKRTSVALLDTYLGPRTGQRVLEGQIKHGDGEHIHAVLWFCDFRDSTSLSESMEQEAYLLHLNKFFDCMAGGIIENGGEVLRFIGDAILAIFPIAGETAKSWENATGALEACRNAIKATELISERIDAVNKENDGLPALNYGIGLHLGDVTYGNIGIPKRLDFTVIGSAANKAARIESMTKELRETVLISSSFADMYPGKLQSAGKHELRGLEGEHELFVMPK